MRAKDVYALVVVADPLAQRDWYAGRLGFTVAFETDWFVYLVAPGERRFGVCFMREGLDHQLPQFRTAIRGDALVLTIEVDDAAKALGEVEATGSAVEVSLRDEPWGQRHFMLRDPAGVWIDVVEQIEPDPGFLSEAARQQLSAVAGARVHEA